MASCTLVELASSLTASMAEGCICVHAMLSLLIISSGTRAHSPASIGVFEGCKSSKEGHVRLGGLCRVLEVGLCNASEDGMCNPE